MTFVQMTERYTEQKIREPKYKKAIKLSLFIMLFTSSLVCLQINGISVNRVGLLPFFIALCVTELRSVNLNKLRINKNQCVYFSFLLVSIFTAIFAIISPVGNIGGLVSAEINYAILTAFIYIPIIILITNSKYKDFYFKTFVKYMLIIIKFHAFFIVVQFFVYAITGINISSLIFDTILHVDTGVMWTSHVYGASIVQRASGLNYDPAFSSYLMILGFVLTEKSFDKLLFFISTVFSQSRTGLLTIIVLFLVSILCDRKSKLTRAKFFKVFGIIVAAVLIFTISLHIPIIKTQFDSLISRVIDISSKSSDSTIRHMAYPSLAIECWIKIPFINKVFGCGPRASGSTLAAMSIASGVYLVRDSSEVWSIECEFAELLLGYGILGVILYYWNVIRLCISKNKKMIMFAIGLIISGFFYDFSSLSINMIVLIFLNLGLSIKGNIKDEL